MRKNVGRSHGSEGRTSALGRRLVATAVAFVAAIGIGMVTAPAAGARTSEPVAVMACGGGTVMTSAPTVTALQNATGSTSPDSLWQSHLYRWNGRSYQLYKSSYLFTARVLSNGGPGMGGNYGYAGPTWYRYNVWNTPGVTSIYFDRLPSGTYALLNQTRDVDGVWTGSWAKNAKNTSVTHCTI